MRIGRTIFAFKFWAGALIVLVAYGLGVHHALTASGLYGRTQGYPFSYMFTAAMALLSAGGAALASTGIKKLYRKKVREPRGAALDLTVHI